jgi:hypothetical protein
VNKQRTAEEADAHVLKLADSYVPASQDVGWSEEQVAAYN